MSNRFDIDIEEVSEVKPVLPAGPHDCKLHSIKVIEGESDNGFWYRMDLKVILTGEEEIKLLGIPEPQLVLGQFLAFNEEGKFQVKLCPIFGQFLRVTGFNTRQADFEEGTEDATSDAEYITQMVRNMNQEIMGMDAIVFTNIGKDSRDETTRIHRAVKLAKAEVA